MGSVESGAPLLNDYKLEFFWKRFPQTLLGGPKLKLGYEAPFYVYLNQVLVFLVPFAFGGLFTFLSEYEVLTSENCCYAYGSIMTIFVVAVQITSWQVRKLSTSVIKLHGNVLAEDDEVEFVSCCGAETINFVFSEKKFAVNMIIHAILSGPHCALLFLYLLPSSLKLIFGSAGVSGLLYVLGWLTVCVAQYSLTVSPPPEPATFRPLDTWEIAPLMRPFYTSLCGIIGVLSNHYTELASVNFGLHVLFCIFPLLWILGMLPPLDALFAWAAEQGLVLVLGGSPMASDFRLFMMLLLSSIVVIMATFIPNYWAVMVLSCAFGYILSINIFGFIAQLWNCCFTSKQPGAVDWGVKECVIHIIMFILTISLMSVGYHFSDSFSTNLSENFETFGFVLIGLMVVIKILGDLQGVYLVFGLIRNPLYPSSIYSSLPFLVRKQQLAVISLFYHILLRYVAPLVMASFLGMFLHPEQLKVGSFAVAIGTVRAARQVWQNSFNCLLDISIVVIITVAVPSLWWIEIGLGLQLMLVGGCRDRIQQLSNKFSFLVTLTVTSWALPKQRHPSTVPLLVTSAIFFPVVLAVLIASTALSAPLLPLFCLPIFLIGFPRPLRTWPRVGTNMIFSSVDAIYYRQLTPYLVSCLSDSMAAGSLGNPAPGDHYLVRFQDRNIWVHVLECGYRYCSLVVKGLELQETSCHTVEAARVDDVFEGAFVHEGKWPIVSVNPHPGNILCPSDALALETYSDANNVLTGIIDQPDNLKRNSENFLKTLVWVLLHYCKEYNARQASGNSKVEQKDIGKDLASVESGIPQSTDTPEKQTPPQDNSKKQSKKRLTNQRSQDDMDLEILNTAAKRDSRRNSQVKRSDSLPSFTGSVWSQESFKVKDFITTDEHEKLEESFNLGGFPAVNIDEKDDNDNDEGWIARGFPVGDMGKRTEPEVFSGFRKTIDVRKPLMKQERQKNNQENGISSFSKNATGYDPVQSRSKEPLSTQSRSLDLPSRWKQSPLDEMYIDSMTSNFPTSWYKYVLESLDLGSSSKIEEVVNDENLLRMYQQFVCTCYALVEFLGYPGSSAQEAGPGHVYKTYNGEIPWSLHHEWLVNDPELKDLVIKAYRFAFKLTYDEAVLGEATSEEEIGQYLTKYNTEWYLGSDTDPQWEKAVMNGVPTLFSIGKGKDKGTYTSRVLTKQCIMAPVGQINSEAVRGQWASLAVELLYLTNDDEERYSIQAHPVLLRNLTIQAADPPLGYPVFASGAISVPLTLHPL